ncbi:MAG: transposase family protein [Puniceicoccales bacterium]|nr:transposase family protein [Puniceicoccales bacterium]
MLKNLLFVFISESVPGSVHDFTVRKQGQPLPSELFLLADSGYQGVAVLHKNSWTPEKKPKNGELSPASLLRNRALSVLRVSIENIFAKIKSFKILSNRYRYRRERYNRIFRIIVGLVNIEMREPQTLAKWQERIRSGIRKSTGLLEEAEKLIDVALEAARAAV